MGNRPGEFSRQSTLGFCRTLKFPMAKQPSRKASLSYHYHYHYHAQRAPMTPPQGYLPIRVLGTRDQSYRRRVATRFHGSIPPVFCNLALVSLDSHNDLSWF